MTSIHRSEQFCSQCGMPQEYDRFTVGTPQALAQHAHLCSYCADPATAATGTYRDSADNTWVLDMLLNIYKTGSDGKRALARMVNLAKVAIPSKVQVLAALVESLPHRRTESDYDALVLYSGGKDSSYMLIKLAARGLRVCAWMLDQGYQSATAIANAQRLCDKLGVTLVIERPQRTSMDTLFRTGFEVGKSSANVELTRAVMTYGSACMPCFAAIAAASTRFCETHHIPLCFIGTQEGQNRLDLNGKPALAGQGLPRLDELVRKFVTPFRDHAQQVHPEAAGILANGACDTVLIPFYEFVKKPEFDDQIRMLEEAGWEMPNNTGACSTNCMMNELGRKVMRTRFGFDLYQVIASHERRMGNGAPPAVAALKPALDDDAVYLGATLIGLSESEMSEFDIKKVKNHGEH